MCAHCTRILSDTAGVHIREFMSTPIHSLCAPPFAAPLHTTAEWMGGNFAGIIARFLFYYPRFRGVSVCGVSPHSSIITLPIRRQLEFCVAVGKCLQKMHNEGDVTTAHAYPGRCPPGVVTHACRPSPAPVRTGHLLSIERKPRCW